VKNITGNGRTGSHAATPVTQEQHLCSRKGSVAQAKTREMWVKVPALLEIP